MSMRTETTRFAPAALLLSTLLAVPTGPAAAQEGEPLGETSAECTCVGGDYQLHLERARDQLTRFFPSRAQLGLYLGEATEADGRPGVRVERVPDGSPAARAGLTAGDVVVALDEIPLGDVPQDGIREHMAGVEPGDTVAVTVYRDGQRRTLQVVTAEATGARVFTTVDGLRPSLGGVYQFRTEDGPGGRLEFTTPSLLLRNLTRDGLELVAVSPELGRHFGTDRGVLVADVDADSGLGLRTGDVILAIADREVRDPAHVRSILASYRADEEIRFRLVRDGRERDVTGRAR